MLLIGENDGSGRGCSLLQLVRPSLVCKGEIAYALLLNIRQCCQGSWLQDIGSSMTIGLNGLRDTVSFDLKRSVRGQEQLRGMEEEVDLTEYWCT